MAAKRVDPLKAKAAKQKKIAIGLCVVFAAVLDFQVPRTLKMLKGPQATPVAAPAVTTPAADPNAPPAAAPAAGVPAAGAPATGVPAPAGTIPPVAAELQPAVLVDSDLPAVATEGQLRSFELFQTKDPFAQQDDVAPAPATTPTPAGATPEVTIVSPGSSIPAPSLTPGGAVASPGASSGGVTPTTVPASASPTPQTPVATPAAATSISVNGLAEDVVPEATFPAADPIFVLVSLGKDGKSVQLGIAGGTYADGAETIKLTLGKPLKLRNTADGSEFMLLLKAVAGFVPPQAPKKL